MEPTMERVETTKEVDNLDRTVDLDKLRKAVLDSFVNGGDKVQPLLALI